jgi:hypothetical protein
MGLLYRHGDRKHPVAAVKRKHPLAKTANGWFKSQQPPLASKCPGKRAERQKIHP